MVRSADIRAVHILWRLGRRRGGLVVADEVLFGLFEQGVFGAMMDVEIVNDGPFTILLEA